MILTGNSETLKTISKYINDDFWFQAKITVKNKDTYFYEIIVNEEIRKMTITSKTYSENFLEGLFNYYEKIITEFAHKQSYLEKISKINNSYDLSRQVSYINSNRLIKPRLMLNDVMQINYMINFPELAENFIKNNKDNIFTQEMIVEYLLYYSGDTYENNSQQAKIDAIEHCKQYPTDREYCTSNDFYDAIVYCDPTLRVFNKDTIKYLSLFYSKFIPLMNNKELVNIFYKTFILSYYKNQLHIDVEQKVKDFNDNDYLMLDTIVDSDFKEHNFLNNIGGVTQTNQYEKKRFEDLVDYINNLTVKEYTQMFNIIKKELYSDSVIKPFPELLLSLCNNDTQISDKDTEFANFLSYSITMDVDILITVYG